MSDRNPSAKVRRDDWGILEDAPVKAWRWECHICQEGAFAFTWRLAQHVATHHARNHHRSAGN